MKTSQKALANSLRDLLKKGMNQNQIASLARVSPATISELINHKREFSERLVKVVSERIRVYAIGDDLAKDVKQRVADDLNHCPKNIEPCLEELREFLNQ